jgi:hypothetical protein
MLVPEGKTLIPGVIFCYIVCTFLTQKGVGLAINDSIFMYPCIYKILRKYFHSESYYVDILDLFHEVAMTLYL